MEFSEAVRRRRMVRNYSPDQIPDDVLDRVLETARRGPSAGFTQGQSFVVVTDPDRRRAIAELAHESEYVSAGFDPWLSRAPVHVVVCTSEAAYRARYAEPDKAGAEDAHDWPVPYWHVDAGASLMLLLLAAVDEGLAAGFAGSHSLGGIKELLGIPPEVDPIGLVTLGHGAPDRRSGSLDRGWKPSAEVVHREQWGSAGE
ncbi:MAG: nitroreductase family protein [Acidimicrobiia bacterium]|nr:nitroreductase family protein [Acidimicrobiia bacterium]